MKMAAARKPDPAPNAPAEPAGDDRKWRRRAHARPEELLDAALDEFIAKGFDAARIEDIAKRAGLSKGAVYLYFDSKEALLRGLIARAAGPLTARAGELARTVDDPLAALTQIVRMISATMGQPRLMAIPQLVISVANRFPDLREFYRTEVVEKAQSAIETLVKRAIARGQVRKVDPRAASRALIGPLLMEALWTHVLKGESRLGTPQWAETQLSLVLRGLEKR
jgi:AcrR family transcriptional regulator